MQSSKKLRGLFINPAKANCSIYESGRMMYESLILSNSYELDYQEVDEDHRSVPSSYDFYAFNYHYLTMGWLDTRFVQTLPGLKLTFVLEVSPGNPFALCPPKHFDAYCVLDPTINIPDKRVYAFPRPLEVPAQITPYRNPDVPVIGSFGFATPGKGFELVVDAVNREFDRAVVRINIPEGTYTEAAFWKLQKQNYADYLADLCKKTAKKGIHVIVSRQFMSKDELIQWCGQNTLNCFLYNRNQPGLAATTDQAISSGRPLAVSVNETFRHIHRYAKPYPFRSLKESIEQSQKEVLVMQRDWAPSSFTHRFEKVLADLNLRSHERRADQQIQLRTKSKLSYIARKSVVKLIKFGKPLQTLLMRREENIPNYVITSERPEINKKAILLVSHCKKHCGIHQYGLNIFGALRKSSRYAFYYNQCASKHDLHSAVSSIQPAAIIYNHYPATMPWLNSTITRQYNIPQMGIMHEVTQEEADKCNQEMFDFHLCPDPTLIENNPIVFKTKRLITPYINTTNLPDEITIGSFGFGFQDKGFERLIEKVQQEFDEARIVLRLPFNDIVDKRGATHAKATASRCQQLIKKTGIKLTINHNFLTKQQLLDFLASNTINAFFYNVDKHRGISSTIEHALAVQRPLAITKCGMFRHVIGATPSICIEDSSLKEIIANGIAPLIPFYTDWSEANFIKDYERILDNMFERSIRKHFSPVGL